MLAKIQSYSPALYSCLVGAFFVLFLHFKWSYSVFPIVLAVIGIALLISQFKNKQYDFSLEGKWLGIAFIGYFLVTLLAFLVHKGKASELDIPSRLLLMLPVFALLSVQNIKQRWVLLAMLLGSVIAGIVGSVQVFQLDLKYAFPQHMRIQSGDVAMTLALFSFALMFYFKANQQIKWAVVSLIAMLSALIGSVLTGARGAWLALPVIFIICVLYRKQISKWIVLGLFAVGIIGGVVGGEIIQKRYGEAEREIKLYFEKNVGHTSVGARFDMWKSAWRGIQEKPLFGWGQQGVKEMRQQHEQEKYIAKSVGRYAHAHNQYLHDATTKGILGFVSLVMLLAVPAFFFVRNLKQAATDSLSYLWSVLGITHVLAMMSYFISQAFLAHNSGVMFYGFVTVVLLALQKNAQNQSLVN